MTGNVRQIILLLGLLVLLTGPGAATTVAAAEAIQAGQPADAYVATDKIFEDFQLDHHIPGIVYGIVADDQLVHLMTSGVQDLESLRPVTADSLFRIASMTKAFTALTVLSLRDDGLLRLDSDAQEYVPEMREWSYPTDDSAQIQVRDLLSHTGGMVTDDPWGDRQQALPEREFTQLITAAKPFSRAPKTAMEYSNLGYALLGRTIGNVSKQPYAETITATLLQPLGMNDSGFEAASAPDEHRALGYRWEENSWHSEPTVAHGAFGAMGGLQTSARDYAKWMAFLLSAWPARDGVDAGPVRRSTVRELATGLNFPSAGDRSSFGGAESCSQAKAYGMGMGVTIDCDLGFALGHGGGYPGYGSYVLLLPDRGVGIFAFANRTYASMWKAVWRTAVALDKAGELGSERELTVATELANAYQVVADIYRLGNVSTVEDSLAINFLLDRGADLWAEDLATLQAEVGVCDTSAPLTATGILSGEFTWRCSHGRVEGSLLLAPTSSAPIQELVLKRKPG